jgi:hypothetical protein
LHFALRMKAAGFRLAFCLAALVSACSDDPAGPPQHTNFAPLFTTLYSNFRAPAKLIISDSRTWAETWNVVGASNGPQTTPPKVDFTDSEVVLVALGERKRAGYQIAIEQVVFTDSSRNVHVLSTAPNEQCSGAEVITTPLDAAVVSKSAKPTHFIEKVQTGTCR